MKTKAIASSLTYVNLIRGPKASNTWFPNWEKCGLKLRNAKFILKLDLRHGSGKWDFTLKVITRLHFHANTEHFKIAFCL